MLDDDVLHRHEMKKQEVGPLAPKIIEEIFNYILRYMQKMTIYLVTESLKKFRKLFNEEL